MTTRDRLIGAARTDIGAARALARARLSDAEQHLALVRARLTQVRAVAAQVPDRVRTGLDRRLETARANHATRVQTLAAQAATAAATHSTGAASAPWPMWQPTPTQDQLPDDPGPSGTQATEPELARDIQATPLPRPRTATDGTPEPAQSRPARETASGWVPGSPWHASPPRKPGADKTGTTDPDGPAGYPIGAPSRPAATTSRAAVKALTRTRSTQPLRVGTIRLPGATEVPAFVDLLDHGHLRLTGPGSPDALVSTVLLRALGDTLPGQVRLYGYDPERLGGGLAGFAPLAPAGVLRLVGPGGLAPLLDELVDHIRRINETVLAGEYSSLRELAAAGRRPEPWRVAVLLREPGGTGARQPAADLSRHEQAQLDRVLRTGAACGVHLILHGFPGVPLPGVEDVHLARGVAELASYPGLPVVLEPPPADLVTTTARKVAEAVLAGPAPIDATSLLPAEYWTESSATGLTTPLGEGADSRPAFVTLGDFPPHALLGGPSGTGKTNLIFAWLAGLASRYSPDELELYLLDFKEGVSFARFAPGQRDPSWLPHVRLVGINVNTDREFGLALLRHLSALLRERADAAKRAEVTTLAELRAEDPRGRWPRIMAVVDEFQVLLAGRDALAAEAVTLLEDLARRGRSQGIHLVLASQDLSGIEALWGRSGLVAQFTLRIALPKARRVLAETNTAADTVPRFHAVVNPDSGAPEANQIVRVPAASDRPLWTALQGRLWQMRAPGSVPPRLFDGDAVPRLVDAEDWPATPATEPPVEPVALVGASIDVRARSARLRLSRAPGRNLAVLGTQVDEACAVLHSTAVSLARAYPPGTARFSIACLDPDATAATDALRAQLPADTLVYDRDTLPDLLAATAATLRPSPVAVPHFLILYAVDAAASALASERPGGSGHANLRRILHAGPELHTHTLGWWRSVGRLRDDLGGAGARLDAIGAWVALDIHGAELTPLYPHPGGPDWHPRSWRGLYFDRSVHRTAEVVIPYG